MINLNKITQDNAEELLRKGYWIEIVAVQIGWEFARIHFGNILSNGLQEYKLGTRTVLYNGKVSESFHP